MHPRPNPDIETQETQPLPFMQVRQKHSLKELRLSCGMSLEQLSRRAGVRLCRVDWMERGVESSLSDVLKVLIILSQTAHYWYCVEDIRGMHIKAQTDGEMPSNRN